MAYLYSDPKEAFAEAERRIAKCRSRGETELDVSRLGLTSLPPSLGELKQLHWVHLRDNQLCELPAALGELKQLRRLSLEGNQLREVPAYFREFTQLTWLNLSGNAELGIPVEVVSRCFAPTEILDYYFRTFGRGAAQPLNEFKLILVGRGGVGKTSLVHRLTAGQYKTFKRTPGIKITRWPLKIDGDDVQAHVWDFGGQEIMHGTHRFFMTERALYLVLISPRESTEDHDAEYWLSLVRSFAGDDAPVIVLLHKWDDAHFELNRELLRDKYGRGLVFLETDSETGHGIKELGTRICELAGAMPGLKAKWPSDWRRVKEELPAAKRNWLAFEDFCAFRHKRGVTQRKDQEALAESLHALGLMLAYRKEEALRGFGVLNPQWVTKGIYDLLNASKLKAKNGKLTCSDFADLLPARNYPAALHPYLLALMRKFKLCFPLDDDGRAYLIPELLTKEEPKARRRVSAGAMPRLHLPLLIRAARGPAAALHRGDLRPPRTQTRLAHRRGAGARKLPRPRPRRRARPHRDDPRGRCWQRSARTPRYHPRALRAHPPEL